MKYEFHVGDYVETKDGEVGYISKVCHCNVCEGRGFYEPSIRYVNGDVDYISFAQAENFGANFKRIGQYDFTKPEQPKEIEKLPNGYGDKFVLYNGIADENGRVSIGVLSSKINELVDAVNSIRESAK